MKKVFAVAVALMLLGLGIAASAAITIDTVAVGDAGNAADTRYGGTYGSVGYNYNIGKYEVTAGQYTAFLNAVAATDTYWLYTPNMDKAVSSWGCNIKRTGTSGNYSYSVASDWANRPVNFVSYWDSCRFANWLGNGQPTGEQNASTTEDGAYTLNGYNGALGGNIQRNPGWTGWAVTSEDEWYKAAYYKGGNTNAGYWDYPTQSDTAPSNVGSDGYTDPGNHANYYNGYTIGSPYYRTIVGEFENSASAYGTFDQGGNVWEWNESIVAQTSENTWHGMRGGAFNHRTVGNDSGDLHASCRSANYTDSGPINTGFRVSYVPEPSSIIALLGGLVGFLGIRRRRA